MKSQQKKYTDKADFLRVRDFLKVAYGRFPRPTNWGLERWNWSRFHPCVFAGNPEGKLRSLESSVRLWIGEDKEILAVLNTENPDPWGEFFIQRVPEADCLLKEILTEACVRVAPSPEGKRTIFIYDHDLPLKAAAQELGFIPKDGQEWWAERPLEGEEPVQLEKGFGILSMADPQADLGRRCRALGLGFEHEDPAEWSKPQEYQRVQTAPDYRPDLDLVLTDREGEYVSSCILWYDDWNRFGVLEPVCTVPASRRQGRGRAVVTEGLNRLYRLGARKVYVGSSQEFYLALGFRLAHSGMFWEKPAN